MSFLTEDPDIANEIHRESIAETLAGIRRKLEHGDFPSYAVQNDNYEWGKEWMPHAQPDVYDVTNQDPWADRYDHPKD